MTFVALQGLTHTRSCSVFEPDFFALGSTIYYCYKQRAPFVSNEQMMEQKAIPHSWRLIPDVARNLIERLLKFDMNERLTDWDEVRPHPAPRPDVRLRPAASSSATSSSGRSTGTR